MNKINTVVLSFACAAALTACNANEEAGRQRYDDSARPIGYYSNEKDMRFADRADQNGNVMIMDDNDGPVTEIMDRTTRGENVPDGNTLNVRNSIDRMNNVSYSTHPDRQQADGLFRSNARLGAENDVNYHGHLNSTKAPAKTSYYKEQNGKVLEDVVTRVERVNGVEDARALVDGNRMLIAVESDTKNPALLENEIRQQLADVEKSYKLHVTVDDGIYNSARNIDNDLRDGGANGLIRTNINSLFENIDNNVNRNMR